MRASAVLLLLLPLILAASPRAQKTDLITLKNGNEITGEIKQLLYGRLKLKTDAMDTVYIEWDEVARVASDSLFRVELLDGTIYYGSFLSPDDAGAILLEYGGDELSLPFDDVDLIHPYETAFLERVGGYINLGFSFTKASDVAQFSAGAGLTYRDEWWEGTIDASTITTDQSNAETVTRRDDVSLRGVRTLGKRWYAFSQLGFNHNDELGIDLRTQLAAGVGHALIRTPVSSLGAGLGFNVNREDADAAGENQTSAEFLVAAQWKIFDLDTPKTDLSARFNLYPSLSESGRYRVDFDARLRKEIVKDFYFDVSFYLDYDSDPPTLEADSTDFGIVTSVGYSW